MFVTITNVNDTDLHGTFSYMSKNFNVIVLFDKGNLK